MMPTGSERTYHPAMHTAGSVHRTVVRQYDRLASVYDRVFGARLQPGRVAALRRLPTRGTPYSTLA